MLSLTDGMKKTLLLIGYGVQSYFDGSFRCIESPNERIDMRSAQALANRKLIYWYTTGGHPHLTKLDLTDAGEILFEELR